ncbi:MAG: fumarylacetoacetate hydrolase family protein [Gammaproteobacteria bacterium]|nr:fumarylacetoacetate hydrolase family protein [Gammaproteobacteria bacterium]
MKFATYQNGTRDGQLMVVSRDLTKAVAVPEIAGTLQAVLDNWEALAPKLQQVYERLNGEGYASAVAFDEEQCHSPLPRAYQWADGSAYINHVELVRKARGADVPPDFYENPLMYQGGSDAFLPPRAANRLDSEDWGIDFEAEVAVVTGDLPMGSDLVECEKAIRLVMLVNDTSLRNLIPGELAKGFGFFQSKPASAFSPVAVTPDELGDAWKDGKVHLPLLVQLNGEAFGKANAGVDMTFNFPRLVAHVAKTRELSAGSIIGSGTVSNRGEDGGPGRPVAAGGLGYSCLAEVRTVETILNGKATTPFMRFGDRVRIEMLDAAGQSVFGAIDQVIARYNEA